MKKNKIISVLSSFGSVGLTVAIMLLNLSGTYFFYNSFSDTSTTKEASEFNGATGYTSADAAQANAQLTNTGDISLIPLGDTFGIKLYTDGVIVTSMAEVYADGDYRCPAKEAGIETGDYITAVSGRAVESNAHFSQLLAENAGQDIVLTIKRGDSLLQKPIEPIYDGQSFRCGMWIRDSAAGIGTLTFADPKNRHFAGLGHGICDIDTKQLMTLGGGEPAMITISDVVKGQKSVPGKINGYFSDDKAIGQLFDNNETGIYGTLDKLPAGQAVPLAAAGEVSPGPAQILVTVDNRGPQLFSAEIERLSRRQNTKNMVIRITDPELLSLTGGIVQGMSGTPVLQNGKLAAAITHVFIDDPTRGYGIFAETMYKNSQKSP